MSNNQKSSARRVIGLLLASHLVVHLLVGYAAFQTGDWQAQLIVGLVFLLELITLGAFQLIRRDRPELAVEVSVGAWLALLPIFSLLIADLGAFLAIAAVIIVLAIASQVLSQRRTNRLIIASIIIGILSLLPDVIDLPNRWLAPPEFLSIIRVVIGLVLVIYIYFIIRQFPNYALRTKLIVIFVAIGILSVGTISLVTNWMSRQALIEDANEALHAAALQTATSIDAFIQANKDIVRVEAQNPALAEYLSLPPEERAGSPQETAVINLLNAFRRGDLVYISSYGLLDAQGFDLVDTYAEDIGSYKYSRDYFKDAFFGGLPAASDIRYSEIADDMSIYFAAPVRNISGEIIGVLRLRYSANVFQQLVAQNSGQVGTGSFAILLDKEYYLRIAHGANQDLLFKTVVPLDPIRLSNLRIEERLLDRPRDELSTNQTDFAAGLARAGEGESYFTAELTGGGGPEAAAVVETQSQPWLVVFAQSEEEFLAPIADQTQATLVVAVLIGLSVAGLAVVFGQILSDPIVHLTAAAQRVAAGELSVQAPVETKDETGQLAEVFNSMTAQLQGLVGSLEEQVQARTTELTLSMEVGQQAAAIRDLEKLLSTITEFIRAQFNLYYVQVYMVDDTGEKLVLRRGTGSVGQTLLERGHSLPIGPGSIVGQVARNDQAIVVTDTVTSDIHKPNSLLPETRSELAVPLRVEGQVIGVLDMQANQPHTFTEKNLTVYEAMATQLALSIESARQWTLAQEAQQRSAETLRRLTRENWAEQLARHRESLGFTYDLSTLSPLQPEAEAEPDNGLSAPVQIQNEAIGRLSVQMDEEKRWSEEEKLFLETVAGQLAQKAETLRLFEQTQQRATREQIARQIADKIRSSRDIETALKTTVRELSKALGVARATVDLQVEQTEEEQ